MKTFFLNLVFYAEFAAFGLCYLPVFFGVLLIDRLSSSRAETIRRLRLRIQWFGRFVVGLLKPIAPVVLEGPWAEAQAHACVYVCNHRSFSDPWLISQLPRGPIVQIVNRWPFRIPVLGTVARLAGYIDIKRMTPECFLEAGNRLLLEQKVMLVSFPEGTRSPNGEIGVFQSAIFRLIKQAGVPVYPFVFSGNGKTPPKGSLVLHPSVIRMRLLPPLTETDYRGWTAFRLKETVRDRIRQALHSMEGAPCA